MRSSEEFLRKALQELLKVPDAQKETVINVMKAMTPLNYEISREKVIPDGKNLLYILRERWKILLLAKKNRLLAKLPF